MAPAKVVKGSTKKDDDDGEGVVEGVSSAHSWIKAQTMIRPSKLGKYSHLIGWYNTILISDWSGTVKQRIDDEDEDDDESNEILITLTSSDPNISTNQIWWEKCMTFKC